MKEDKKLTNILNPFGIGHFSFAICHGSCLSVHTCVYKGVVSKQLYTKYLKVNVLVLKE